MLLQAWDFLQLFDRYGCRLQMGGSDQWGNITEGVDLIRRRREAQAFGLTSPLVTKADGTKFGKTETGTVWLDPARTSPVRLLPVLASARVTPRWAPTCAGSPSSTGPRIEELDRATAAHPERREAQRVLAREVTCHGARARRGGPGRAGGRRSCSPRGSPGSTRRPSPRPWPMRPTLPVTRAELEAGLGLVDALLRTGLASSRGDARRLLAGGGVYVNNRRQAGDRPSHRGRRPGRPLRGAAPRARASTCWPSAPAAPAAPAAEAGAVRPAGRRTGRHGSWRPRRRPRRRRRSAAGARRSRAGRPCAAGARRARGGGARSGSRCC